MYSFVRFIKKNIILLIKIKIKSQVEKNLSKAVTQKTNLGHDYTENTEIHLFYINKVSK